MSFVAPISAWSLVSAIGVGTDVHRGALASSERRLEPCSWTEAAPGFWGRVRLPNETPGPPGHLEQMTEALVDDLEPALDRIRARYEPSRVGVVLGSATSAIDETEIAIAHFKERGALPPGYYERRHNPSLVLEVVKRRACARGPAWLVPAACSSGSRAIAAARRLLRDGVADAVIAGGIECLTRIVWAGFAGMRLLSPAACRPFSAAAAGASLGEGGALFLLERGADAPFCVIGAGESCAPPSRRIQLGDYPAGFGASEVMESALRDADLAPGDVGLIHAHSVGVAEGDRDELNAITKIFGDTPVVSTKALTGHCIGAEGPLGLAFSLLMLERGEAAPTINPDEAPAGREGAVTTRWTPLRRRTALVNAFGMGGMNSTLIARAS